MPFALREGEMLMITKILWIFLAVGGKFQFHETRREGGGLSEKERSGRRGVELRN